MSGQGKLANKNVIYKAMVTCNEHVDDNKTEFIGVSE